MSGVPKIEVRESIEELKLLMKQHKTGLGYAKVQSLYLLKAELRSTRCSLLLHFKSPLLKSGLFYDKNNFSVGKGIL